MQISARMTVLISKPSRMRWSEMATAGVFAEPPRSVSRRRRILLVAFALVAAKGVEVLFHRADRNALAEGPDHGGLSQCSRIRRRRFRHRGRGAATLRRLRGAARADASRTARRGLAEPQSLQRRASWALYSSPKRNDHGACAERARQRRRGMRSGILVSFPLTDACRGGGCELPFERLGRTPASRSRAAQLA